MKNITNYYVEDKSKLISNKDAYIVGKKFRITVLSHRLVRIEYSEKGLFEDRPTSLIINRSFPKIDYFITELMLKIVLLNQEYYLVILRLSLMVLRRNGRLITQK